MVLLADSSISFLDNIVKNEVLLFYFLQLPAFLCSAKNIFPVYCLTNGHIKYHEDEKVETEGKIQINCSNKIHEVWQVCNAM
jgi:hypothetical protein